MSVRPSGDAVTSVQGTLRGATVFPAGVTGDGLGSGGGLARGERVWTTTESGGAGEAADDRADGSGEPCPHAAAKESRGIIQSLRIPV
nr:hypothetical protein [Actinomycetales bacterium]